MVKPGGKNDPSQPVNSPEGGPLMKPLVILIRKLSDPSPWTDLSLNILFHEVSQGLLIVTLK